MSLIATLATTVIPALLPAATDGIRAFINRKAKGAQYTPGNFEDHLDLMRLDIERLKALKDMDAHNNVNMPWQVDAIRSLQRPFFGASILLCYIGAISLSADVSIVNQLGDYVSMFGFYLFGERAYMYQQNRAK